MPPPTLRTTLTRPSLSLPYPHAPTPPPTQSRTFTTTCPRHATLLKRPHRPYTFTQLLTLSDGSTFTHRTTSPQAVYKSNKDVRNTLLWNPSNARIAGVEEDEAGRLRAFRLRFGRGWDAQAGVGDGEEAEGQRDEQGEALVEGEDVGARAETGDGREGVQSESQRGLDSGWSDAGEDNLMDLIGSYGLNAPQTANVRESPKGKKGKGKR